MTVPKQYVHDGRPGAPRVELGERWYVLHDHGDGQRHGHSTAQHHPGDVNNSRADDHAGVETVETWEEARLAWRAQTNARRGA